MPGFAESVGDAITCPFYLQSWHPNWLANWSDPRSTFPAQMALILSSIRVVVHELGKEFWVWVRIDGENQDSPLFETGECAREYLRIAEDNSDRVLFWKHPDTELSDGYLALAAELAERTGERAETEAE